MSTQPSTSDLSVSNGKLPTRPTVSVSTEEPDAVGEDAWSLSRIVGMVRRKAMVIGVLAIAISTYMGFRTTQQVPQYQSSFDLLVEPVQKEQELAQLTDSQNTSTSTSEMDYSTQIEVLLSPKTLNPIIDEVRKEYADTTYASVISHLAVSQLGETKIIQVTYYDTDPDKVKFILEEISQAYLKYSLEAQQGQLRQGLNFVEEQLPQIRQRVNTLQQQLQDLQQEYNFIDPAMYSEQLSSQLGATRQQRQTLQAELAALQTQYQIVQQQIGVNETLTQSSTYQALLQQFQVLEQQIAIESARFGPRDPKIQLLYRQQDNLQPLLQAEAQRVLGNQLAALGNQIQILTARDRAIAATEIQLNQLFRQMPAVSREFTELQRELSVATESLTRFLETQDRLEVQAAQKEIPWQLIAEPRDPQRKASTSLYKALMTGAMMGLVLGLIAAYLLEKQENTYYSTPELQKGVKLPILGMIPYHVDLVDAVPKLNIVDLRQQVNEASSITEDLVQLKSRVKNLLNPSTESLESLDLLSDSISVTPPATDDNLGNYWLNAQDAYNFIEAFRALCANLKQSEPLPRSLVISSALPTEGRTTVAVHLVQAAAAMGQRVLLVDAHLRRGGTQIHTLLGLQNQIGLSHFLMGKASLNQAIQRLAWEPGLFVITAGVVPPDPTRLLSSEQMHSMMARLHKTFDLVVYDMPPLMGLADVSLLASYTDGVVLVAGLGKRHSADALKQAIARLKLANLPILGVVANKAKDHSVNLYRNSSIA
ncbi:MAG: polysaccharide biosynthesis tyrosine autokinase [Oculatellaceae cyanobacterium bins.114]|nr:polysaccharide biosynthesis tyrosine autokinase [Oculatellaceae cyanobacterium bins.114]